MPTYEYECEACGHAFERFQSMSEDPLRVCPECGGAVRRLISSGGGLVFKGPGFYATDYRRGTAGGSASRSGKGSEEAGAPAGGKEASKTGRSKADKGTSSGGGDD